MTRRIGARVERIEPKLTPAVVLIIDDDAERSCAVASAMRTAFGQAAVRTSRWDEAAGAPSELGADVVIMAPRAVSDDSLAATLAEFKPIPTIVLASATDPQSAVNAVLNGASDAVVMQEQYLDLLPSRVSRVLARVRAKPRAERRGGRSLSALHRTLEENRELRSRVSTLQIAAMLDPLTGVCNRRALDARLAALWETATACQSELSCLVIDVDHFKRINDTYGHAAGDLVLTMLARVLVEQCRHDDVAARAGGDEFVAVLPHAGMDAARVVGQRLQEAFARAVASGSETVKVAKPTLSIGVSSRTANVPVNAQGLLEHADDALYASKHEGRNRICMATGQGQPRRLAAAG